jgi:hypothetical protein
MKSVARRTQSLWEYSWDSLSPTRIRNDRVDSKLWLLRVAVDLNSHGKSGGIKITEQGKAGR